PTELSALPAVDTAGLAAGALTALATAPQVTVDADTAWSFDIPKVKGVKEEVAPPPAPPVRSETPTSRGNAPRTETPAKDGGKVPQAVKGNKVLEIAARYVGVPYRSGGSSPKGFDCSGFTQYVYGKLGIKLPRTTGAQKNAGTVVSRKDAKPGDLIWSPGHVGIYAGDNMQIDAPRPGKTIQFRSIWQSNPVFIRITGWSSKHRSKAPYASRLRGLRHVWGGTRSRRSTGGAFSLTSSRAARERSGPRHLI